MERLRFPKAQLYKEWRQKRWVAWFVFLLCVPSVYLNTIGPALDPAHRHIVLSGSNPAVPSQHIDVVALNFKRFCDQLMGPSTVGWWASLVFVGLAAYSMWTERRGAVQWFTLSGPVSRASIVTAKVMVDWAILVGVWTVAAASLAIIDGTVSAGYPVTGILRWWAAEIAVQGAMYGLGLLFAVLIANPVVSGLLSFAVAWVPIYTGVLLTRALGANLVVFGGSKPIPWSWNLMWTISHLSPINWVGLDLTQGWAHPARYLVGFMVCSVVAAWASRGLFRLAETERLDHVFLFRSTGVVMGLAACGAVAFLCARLVNHGRMGAEMTLAAALTVVFWAVMLVARQRIGRLR